MFGKDHPAGGLYVLRLVLIESDPSNRFGEHFGICIRVVCRCPKIPEQFLGYFVNLFVGALGGEDCGDEEFQWI